jgi:hypothetical protein
MGFLDSVQQGLEKASKGAGRLSKIQRLRSANNDLTFKASQHGQYLIAQTMDLYRAGHLLPGELAMTCEKMAAYQQQIAEVQAELLKLQGTTESGPVPGSQNGQAPASDASIYPPLSNESDAMTQMASIAPPPPPGYPTYPASPAANYPTYPPGQTVSAYTTAPPPPPDSYLSTPYSAPAYSPVTPIPAGQEQTILEGNPAAQIPPIDGETIRSNDE